MNKEIRSKAEAIAKDFALSIKERTDALLKLDTEMYMELGKDTTKKEKKEVKQTSKYIFKQLKGFNESDAEMLLRALDE